MIVVSNSSPLMNLAAIDHLDLLRQLYGTVSIPQAVFDEITVAGAGLPGCDEVQALPWIDTRQVADRVLIASLRSELDEGEAEALALAIELRADLVLLDERLARAVATRVGLRHMGLLGCILEGKRASHIPAVRPLLDALVTLAGFWFSAQLYAHILQTAGE
jgi:hypothetical protein